MDAKMKRGQMAIWVILAIILAASILLFFALQKKPEATTISGSAPIEVTIFVEQCIESHVQDAVALMLPHGGFVNPVNSVWFDKKPVEYLCENIGWYEPCVNQHPMLVREMEKEIVKYLGDGRMDDCFEMMKAEVSVRSGSVNFLDVVPEIDVDLEPDKILVNIKRDTEISIRGESKILHNYRTEIISPAYNLAEVAREIAKQEATYCHFEYIGYKAIYPRYTVKPYEMSTPTTIYLIEDTETNQQMRIAIRSCAIPPGL